MKKSSEPELPPVDDDLRRQLRSMTRRGFAWGGLAALSGLGAWRWIVSRSPDQGIPWPLRGVLEFDEKVHHAAFASSEARVRIPARRRPGCLA